MSDYEQYKVIYLQRNEANPEEGRLWCQDRIYDNDDEYVLASDYAALKAELEPWREMMKQWATLQELDYIVTIRDFVSLFEDVNYKVTLNHHTDSTVEVTGETLPEAVKAAYDQVMGVG